MAKYLAMRIEMGKLDFDEVITRYPKLESEIKGYLSDGDVPNAE
ncbi:hypothetical protein ACDZ28_03915 [Paenibacillus sp. RS8]